MGAYEPVADVAGRDDLTVTRRLADTIVNLPSGVRAAK